MRNPILPNAGTSYLPALQQYRGILLVSAKAGRKIYLWVNRRDLPMTDDEVGDRIADALSEKDLLSSWTVYGWTENGIHFAYNVDANVLGVSDTRYAIAHERAVGTSEEELARIFGVEAL